MRIFYMLMAMGFSHLLLAQERLIIGGGSLTEIAYALGAQDMIVAVDSSSTYPASAKALPQVGYYRHLNTEGLVSLKPTKVILLEGAGPAPVLRQLEALGINTLVIKAAKSQQGLLSTIKRIAKETHRQRQGEQLIAQLEQAFADIARLPKLDNKSAVFLMSATNRGLMAAGKDTTAQLIFDALKITNPFADIQGFKTVSEEALAQHQPDMILVANHTTRGLSEEALCQSEQLKLWVSIKGCNLVKIDSLPFLGLTPRLPQAMQQTHELLGNL